MEKGKVYLSEEVLQHFVNTINAMIKRKGSEISLETFQTTAQKIDDKIGCSLTVTIDGEQFTCNKTLNYNEFKIEKE